MPTYADFIESKTHLRTNDGFEPVYLPPFLFDFQASLIEWSVRKGRAAILADCGLGKGPMSMVWAENVVRHTNKPVLILAPLAVSQQFVHEGEKFGVEVRRNSDGKVRPGINVTNYERLHLFDPNEFGGVVCDESAILKNFDGRRKTEITEFMRKMRYRLLGTATAAPNDYIELGTSSEALGYLGHMDMLNRFFKNDQNTSDTKQHWRTHGGARPQWRFKGHAEEPFWKWVCSWARAIRRPSDLEGVDGRPFDDARFVLPPLLENEHTVEASTLAPGQLFAMPATTLPEQREERRRTITERCEMVARLVDHSDPALVWCHLNPEGDRLASIIPGAVQVSGSDSDDKKEETLTAFAEGQIRVLVTKPKIGAWGLNFQHCAHVTTFPSHSFEQYYQSVRRCWRFGQTRPVTVDIVTTEGELGVLKNLQRKSVQADRMFGRLVAHMNDALHVSNPYNVPTAIPTPSWITK